MSAPAVCLIVLDGWGLAEPGPGNAVERADTPVFDELWERHPHTTLTAWGRDVGLPEGQMGNSEVGHLNLGAGAIVKQDLTRIDDAIEDGSFFENEALRAACHGAERLHLLGLVSEGGVHASMGHLKALAELAERESVGDVVLHAFTDGRDTPPKSGAAALAAAERWPLRVATVSGRYFAMDRDRRWERTGLAFDAIVAGESEQPHAATGQEAAEAAYERDETDEFISPTVVGEEGRVRDGDSLVFFNFRPDRARQLTTRLGELDVRLTTLTEYDDDFGFPIAFPPSRPDTTLAKVLAEAGVEQLHVAETEKYAHVTYFFNGGEEDPYAGEERELVDSPRDVATYDEKPEMSAREAAGAFVHAWEKGHFGFGIINFANPDMVGHTGDIEAAVMAVEAVDECLGEVVEAVHAKGGVCVITADHGNADDMLEADGSPQTAHSMNPVPLIVTGGGVKALREGILADVAPTVLALMGREQPREMTGTPLRQG